MTDGRGLQSGQGWRRRAIAAVGLCLALAACSQHPASGAGGVAPRAPGETRPNILVIEVDHLGTELGAYGDAAAQTPNIDRLTREGVRFDDAYAAAGSEDAETVALLTGMHPSTIGMVQEWSGPAAWTVAPPPEIKAYPELVRAAGYATFHVGSRPDPFGEPASLWTQDETSPGAVWPSGVIAQPFLGVIDLSTLDRAQGGAPSRGFWSRLAFWRKRDVGGAPSSLSVSPIAVPAYLPDTPQTRTALQAEYARDRGADEKVGAILKQLERSGLADHTIIVFTAKSGPVRPRAERTVYDAGAHTPLIVRWSDGRGGGTVRRDLISGIDVAPAILRMAGVAPRAWMQGQDHLADAGAPNTFVFTVQNRVDNVYERVFAVRDGRYLYVLNLAPYTPVLSLARPGKLSDAVIAARKTGRLSRGQAAAYSDERGEAELYDLKADPQELRNLVADPAHAGDVARLAQVLNAFAAEAPDYSTWTARDLGDLFKPGGVTSTTAPPEAVVRGRAVTLSSLTPGASILWRRDPGQPWTLYTGPIPLSGPARLEATAERYGFLQSPVAKFTPAP